MSAKTGRSIFKSTITLGMISIPVKALTVRRSKKISFNRVCNEAHKIKYKYYCPQCDKEYEYKDLKKGFKVGDKMMVFEKEFIDKMQKLDIDGMQIIGLKKFEEIDNRAFNNQYYLVPEGTGKKPFYLFREILAEKGVCAVVKYAIRNKAHLAVICPYKNVLKLTNLYYPDEIVEAPEIKEPDITEDELELGHMLLDKISQRELDPNKLVDDTRIRLEKMIEEKLMGKEVAVEEVKVPKEEKEPDLTELLKKSIELEDKKENEG